jgi:sulfite reductase (NADPH) flavoprotein alpha-component
MQESTVPRPSAITRESPLLAPVIEKRSLTDVTSTKSTIHIALAIEGTGLEYEVGDAMGVIPTNDLNLVSEILQLLNFHGNEEVASARGGATTLYEALARERQITRLSRRMMKEYATRGQVTPLLRLLETEHQAEFDAYVHERGLIDLLVDYPGVMDDPAALVHMLPKLTPRLYSIASSPAAHVGEIHTTVAVVRFSPKSRNIGGVCSTFFADRTLVEDRLPIYIQANKKFRLPTDSDAPIIMIGPGTGIAPFRAFLHERRALGQKGRNWLFFGERSSKTDYLYREELESMHGDGHLTRLETAFSRDLAHKVYVQNRMIEQAAEFWKWLQEGASVYVCGDAAHMAKDVHAALHRIVEEQGAMSAEAAEKYVAALRDEHRYHRDVY